MPNPFRSSYRPSRTLLATALMLAGLSTQAAELTDMIGRTVQAPDRIERVFAVAPIKSFYAHFLGVKPEVVDVRAILGAH